MDKLNKSGIKLTDLEKEVIQAGLNQGSYYWEDTDPDDPETKSLFIGYDCAEDCGDPKAARGAVASLVKKGVLDVVYDNSWYGHPTQACYYIKYALDFEEGSNYKIKWEC